MTQIYIPDDLVNTQQFFSSTKLLLELNRSVADSELGKGCKALAIPAVSFDSHDYVLYLHRSNRHGGASLENKYIFIKISNKIF